MSVAANIAADLGAAYHSGAWWRCRCPVHNSHGPTLALRDGDRALVVKCFAGCDPCDVLAELRYRGLLADAVRTGRRRTGKAETGSRGRLEHQRNAVLDDHAKRTGIARRIW